MLILALDSTATVATAAICDNETVLAAETVSCGLKHSETLLPMIENFLGLPEKKLPISICFPVRSVPVRLRGCVLARQQ